MKTQVISMLSEQELRRILKEEISSLFKQLKVENIEDTSDYVKIGSICKTLSASRTTVYQLVKDGQLDLFKSGRRSYFSHSQAVALITPVIKKS